MPTERISFFTIILEYLESVQILRTTTINSINKRRRDEIPGEMVSGCRTIPTPRRLSFSFQSIRINTPNFARKPAIVTIIIVFP